MVGDASKNPRVKPKDDDFIIKGWREIGVSKKRQEAFSMADGARFELALGFRPKHTFQACAFNHSATHPSE